MYVILFLLAGAVGVFAQDSLKSAERIGDYTFTIQVSNYGMTHELIVHRRDKVVWTLSDFFLKVLNSDSLGLPRDLTGDYVQDVVIETYSGGAHCCFAQYVVTLGTKFEIIDTIANPGQWSDLDQDGLWEVTAGDLTFDYWKLPHSDSPIPLVVLEASPKGFVPSAELTKTPAPSAMEILAMLKEAREGRAYRDYDTMGESDFLPASQAILHRNFIDLVYTGHADIAMEYLDLGWPLVIHGREQYVLDVLEVMRKSPYWNLIAAINPGTMFGN